MRRISGGPSSPFPGDGEQGLPGLPIKHGCAAAECLLPQAVLSRCHQADQFLADLDGDSAYDALLGEAQKEQVNVMEGTQKLLKPVDPVHPPIERLARGRGGQPELGLEALLPTSPRVERLHLAGPSGTSLMARHLLKGAAKAIGNAVGVDPLGKLRTQSASEFNQGIGGPDDVGRCRCLCGPLGTEGRGGGLNLGRRLLGKSTQKSGENNGIPRTSDRGGGCADGLVEFQQVGRRIAFIGEAKGGAEGLADETELVDREVPGLASALGGRMAGEARAPLGKSLADGPLTTEP